MGPSTPIRVLQLAESPYFGGITSHILAVAEAFRDDDRIQIIVATLPGRHQDKTLVESGHARGIHVHELPMVGTFDARIFSKLRHFLAEHEIDLVHTHNYRATLLSALAARKMPVVNTCHGMKVAPTARVRAWQWAELKAMKRHRLTIACSDYVRRWLMAQGLPAEQLRIVYNGYVPSESNETTVTRASLEIADDAFVVAYVGRLVAGKGLDDLVEAVSHLPNVQLLITGDGPLRTTLETQTREAKVQATYLGQVDQPSACYRIADVVALPSEMEAFPMSLIEAAAHGKPVIASRVGGIPEIVRDGETGILFDAGDVCGLQEALTKLSDGELREQMGVCARRHWQENFSNEIMKRQLTEVYERSVGR